MASRWPSTSSYDRILFASCSMTLSQLGQYIVHWRASNQLVESVMGWKGRYERATLCVASRPGAWLADFMYTLVLIEKGGVSQA